MSLSIDERYMEDLATRVNALEGRVVNLESLDVNLTGGLTPAPVGRGDMLRATAALAWERFPHPGAASRMLTTNANDPLWSSAALTIPAVGGTAALGAGTLTVATANDVTAGNHTHAITSSSNPGANARLLASDAGGYLRVERFAVGAAAALAYGVKGVTTGRTAGVLGQETSGWGVHALATSGVGLVAAAVTGVGLVVDLTGAGTAIAQFLDNGAPILTVEDGGRVELTAPATLDLNGQDLIIDADGDSYLHEVADDQAQFVLATAAGQLRININGADDFTFLANSLRVETGSKVDLNGGELVIDADGDSYLHEVADDQARFVLAGAGGQLRVNINGADDFIFKANELSVEAGSFLSAFGVRATLATAAGLYVPWITGDGSPTSYFGSANAANNQYAVQARSYSSHAVHAQSMISTGIWGETGAGAAAGVYGQNSSTGIGVEGVADNAAGEGVKGSSVNGVGLRAVSNVGTALSVNLIGAGAAIAEFLDNGTSMVTIDDGGNVGIGSGLTAPSEKLVVGVDFGALAGTRISVGESGAISGFNFGEDVDNRGFMLWSSTLDFVNLGSVVGGVLYSSTIALHDGQVGIGAQSPGSLMEWNFADEDLEFVDCHTASGVSSLEAVVEVITTTGATGYIPIYGSYS
jgi:hypothetical protein